MPPATSKRQVRERELVAATRSLFDARGVLEAPIEEIAQQVGIARGLVYRHFSSKEELYVATVCDYLRELGDDFDAALGEEADPALRLELCMKVFAEFCERYPAFLDSSLSLMQRPARELYEVVSEAIWLRLGQGMARCIDNVARILRDGNASGAFEVEDPDYLANLLWTQALGAMHLARIRVGVKQLAPGVPTLFTVAPEDIVRSCVVSAMATVTAPKP